MCTSHQRLTPATTDVLEELVRSACAFLEATEDEFCDGEWHGTRERVALTRALAQYGVWAQQENLLLAESLEARLREGMERLELI